MAFPYFFLFSTAPLEKHFNTTPSAITMPSQFLFLLLSLLMLAFSSAFDRNETLPGCQPKCGNVNITYPFGIGNHCSLAPWAEVICNSTFTPHKAFLGEVEIAEISLNEVRIKNSIGTTCYDRLGRTTLENPSWINLTGTPFTFSTKNKLTAIGCDTFVIASFDDNDYASACVSLCPKIKDLRNGSCTGVGCCQASIRNGLKNMFALAGTLDNNTISRSIENCSTTFLVEEEKYTFKLSDLTNATSLEDIPILLNFGIGNQTCNVAKQNATSFACKGNSSCSDSEDGTGYVCNCNHGYEGNPYIDQNCQDINECHTKPCEHKCTNTPGSYKCSCPRGYYGDGTKNGSGCTKKRFPVLPLGLGLGVGFLILFSCGYCGIRKRKHSKLRQNFFRKNGGLLLKQKISSHKGDIDSTKIFTVAELKLATNNYDHRRIIGQGGSGTVYKGILPDETLVAIKKSKLIDESQIGQFINEVAILTQINHRNVVKLIGCCLETEVPLLVYEFVPNGTLFHHLHRKVGAISSLSWQNRLRIAAETAGAIAYLHSAATIPIIHRDVKSANILLDDNYTAKVADFGASRLNPLDQTQISTLVQGTMGYVDPEYLDTSQLTERSDVYGFGVVLAELLTGETPLSFDRSEKDRNLAVYFVRSLKENRLFDLLEAGVVEEGKTEQVLAVAELAKRCLHFMGEERPSMKEVTAELEGLMGFQKHKLVRESNERKMGSADEQVSPCVSPIVTFHATSSASFMSESSSGCYRGENEQVLRTSSANFISEGSAGFYREENEMVLPMLSVDW